MSGSSVFERVSVLSQGLVLSPLAWKLEEVWVPSQAAGQRFWFWCSQDTMESPALSPGASVATSRVVPFESENSRKHRNRTGWRKVHIYLLFIVSVCDDWSTSHVVSLTDAESESGGV